MVRVVSVQGPRGGAQRSKMEIGFNGTKDSIIDSSSNKPASLATSISISNNEMVGV